MGADIHGVLQYRIGSTWLNQELIPDHRNYALFAALADVRNYNDITPISELRGMPEDFPIKGEYFKHYGQEVWMGEHSYSWLGIDEMLNWDKWHELDGREVVWLKWLEYAKASIGSYEGRIVFGFDS